MTKKENLNERIALNIADFCELYSVCRAIAYREMRDGRLKYRHRGGRRLIRKIDADAWLNALPEGDASS